jgi:hypothetical protein
MEAPAEASVPSVVKRFPNRYMLCFPTALTRACD